MGVWVQNEQLWMEEHSRRSPFPGDGDWSVMNGRKPYHTGNSPPIHSPRLFVLPNITWKFQAASALTPLPLAPQLRGEWRAARRV